jgi:RHS repeat-associated protein
MTYEDGTSTPAGDKYSGLDNFGRVVESLWMKGTTVIENVAYGYSRASNRQWRRNQLAHANGGAEATRHDNFYWYDGLYQVVQRQLGNLTGTAPAYTGIDYRQQNEGWCYDPIGNWNHYDNEAESNLSQSRGHNKANEIILVTNPSGVVQPAYDKVGNQTADIAPGDWDRQFDLKWDAWNRLVGVRDGMTLVQINAYDGLTRRTTSDDGAATIHYYYNTAWRAVEQYVNAATSPERRHLWGLRSRWDLVKRERDAAGSLDEKRYVLYDAMDPVAICDEYGGITQRFEYSPFGRVSFMDADFTPDGTPEPWDFLFHGEFRDAATGYYNYGYRFYNDTTGRWPSRDPIGENGGVNLYGFLGNDGVGKTDALGLAEVQYHHWLMQAPRFKAMLDGICPGLEPDKYTTPYSPGTNQKGTPHHMIHFLLQNAALIGYQAAYVALLTTVENLPPPFDKYKCCALLMGVETLKNGAHQLVKSAFGIGDGKTKWSPPLFTYPEKNKLPVPTDDSWTEEMIARCACVPENDRFKLWEIVTRPLRGIPIIGVEPPPSSVVPDPFPLLPFPGVPVPPVIPRVIDPPTIPEELITPPVSGEELRQLAIIGGGVVVIGGVVYLVVASGGSLAPVLVPLLAP